MQRSAGLIVRLASMRRSGFAPRRLNPVFFRRVLSVLPSDFPALTASGAKPRFVQIAALAVAIFSAPAVGQTQASADDPAAASAATAASAASGIELRKSQSLQAPVGDDLPVIIRAREVRARPDQDAEAVGDVEFRRGGTVIRSDQLTYDQAEDLARATGNVVVSRDGSVFTGPEVQLQVDRFEGYFRSPTYRFTRTGAGGKATRIDFIDPNRAMAIDASYTSCTPNDPDPAWVLETGSLAIDRAANEGVARDAVLRFYGVPIFAAPVLSFPLTDARKSGFLPPTFGLDSRSGVQASIPYYWNIAPNRDATFTPSISSRRGVALDSEFRYVEPRFGGEADFRLMPHDAQAGRSRYALRFDHDGLLPGDALLRARVLRVSDDNYWKDFPGELATPTPRLLRSELAVSRPFGDWSSYARVERWQVLQTEDPSTRIDPVPYERVPQVGARYAAPWTGGFDVGFETEVNRFADPNASYQTQRQTGVRLHAIGAISRPFYRPGWTLTPRLAFNSASYMLDQPLADGRRSATRLVPTLSVDSAWTLERDTAWFGRSVRQTLEPRLFYANTPFRQQNDLPNFDSAVKDVNFDSIYTSNAFSGVDRVSDSHLLTAGVTSRILDPETGAEALRLGIAQRFFFRDQEVTANSLSVNQRLSDVLVAGSTTLVPHWSADASAQYNSDTRRIERSLAGLRYSPGPYRTVSFNYRLTRGLSEQVELGWQWPVYGDVSRRSRSSFGAGAGAGHDSSGNASCSGALYSVGRVNYSRRDSRLVDSLIGFEYDAGCWIGRVVAERLSTGRSETTTRLLVQLELIGLSRLGASTLRVLKDNIPGYQVLRDNTPAPTPFTPYE